MKFDLFHLLLLILAAWGWFMWGINQWPDRYGEAPPEMLEKTYIVPDELPIEGPVEKLLRRKGVMWERVFRIERWLLKKLGL